MRKVQLVDMVSNRYLITDTVSGRTDDIYLSDGFWTIKLEDCLIWEDEEFTDEDFYSIVADCEEDAEAMLEQGWSIVSGI